MKKKKKPPTPHGSKHDKENPCAICGWAAHMAIHLPVDHGPRKGQPWGHAYQDQAEVKEPTNDH